MKSIANGKGKTQGLMYSSLNGKKAVTCYGLTHKVDGMEEHSKIASKKMRKYNIGILRIDDKLISPKFSPRLTKSDG